MLSYHVAVRTAPKRAASVTNSSTADDFRFFRFFCIPSSPFYSLHPSRNSDPGSHSRLFSPPTQNDSCLALLSREDFSSFFPRRLASDCAYPRWALSVAVPFLFERSEFLIDTSQKKSLRVCTRARSSTSLGLSVSYYVPHTYVSQLGSQDTYM